MLDFLFELFLVRHAGFLVEFELLLVLGAARRILRVVPFNILLAVVARALVFAFVRGGEARSLANAGAVFVELGDC